MKWIVASDHAGYDLRTALVSFLTELGDDVVDLGCDAPTSCDYPDFAKRVVDRVLNGEGTGLLVCGTGIGMSMTANRFPGIRAAVVTDAFTAAATRQHNDANILCMGQRVIGTGVAQAALHAFRDARYEGGRHQRRVDKIERGE